MVYKGGGAYLQRLNTQENPVVKKYREGTMKSTLKRGLKVSERAKSEVKGVL